MKVPYALTAAVKTDDRYVQMQHAVDVATARGYPRLEQVPITESRVLTLACYGPSLADTYQQMRSPILSMSGATRFLADRGIIPDFHVDMDPRSYKARHLEPPVDGVNYLMASVCPPQTWEILKDRKVTLWHTYSGADSHGVDTYQWVAQHDPGQLVIHGGSTIGLTALHVGGVLGYRHFEIHGMDGNRREDGVRHAGVHYGKPQNDPITWDAEGRRYQTSQIMANAVAETINTVRRFPIFCVFHGDGLTQALVREARLRNACTANQTEKAERIRKSVLRVVEMPQGSSKTCGSYWDALLDALPKDAVPELIRFAQQAERLRVHAKFNTGSIPLETALQLRALCCYYQPKIIVEIGTFIGTSTYAMVASERLYTCDKDNDCLAPTDNIVPHPYTGSTAMFRTLVDEGHAGDVDLFFFDGRIQNEDILLIQHLSHPKTIYAFDDCTDGMKGVANIQKLLPHLQSYGVIPPNPDFHGRSTLGLLMPLVAPSV
jgi:predicted O-methyltransferase YrrM